MVAYTTAGNYGLAWVALGLTQPRPLRTAATVWGTLAADYGSSWLWGASGRPLTTRFIRLPASSSFPSSHAAMSTAAAIVLSEARPQLAPLWAALAAAMCLSRLYVGAHHAGDVAAGVRARRADRWRRAGGCIAVPVLGMLGLPWSGVTTTLRCLAGSAVAADAGQGVADVRDPRLAELARVSKSKRVVAATLEVADLTKLVRGAKRGEGLGNELLAHMRTTDALLMVVRCFMDEQVPHSEGRVDPVDDAETVELELVFADQAVVDGGCSGSRRPRNRVTSRSSPSGSSSSGWPPRWRRGGRPGALGEQLPDTLDLLTAKPALYVANVDESGTPRASSGCARSAPSAASRRSR